MAIRLFYVFLAALCCFFVVYLIRKFELSQVLSLLELFLFGFKLKQAKSYQNVDAISSNNSLNSLLIESFLIKKPGKSELDGLFEVNDHNNHISYKILAILMLVAGILGYGLGRLKSFLFKNEFSNTYAQRDSLSPELDGDEYIDKIEEDSFESKQQEKKLVAMIDNTNFDRNFYDHEKISSKSLEEVYTAKHILDKQTYMIKKTKVSLRTQKDLMNTQILKNINYLKQLNSKYISRYITSWLEEEKNPRLETKFNIILCVQMEIYTDIVLKYWLQSGIDNKRLCFHIFKQLTKGLKHIHAKGISHGNFKSKNIYLNRRRSVKIANFSFNNPDIHSKTNQEKDILNLTIILIELFMLFDSKIHRKQVITTFKDSHIVPYKLYEKNQEVYSLINFILKTKSEAKVFEKILKYS
jgi:Protein kinase domain